MKKILNFKIFITISIVILSSVNVFARGSGYSFSLNYFMESLQTEGNQIGTSEVTKSDMVFKLAYHKNKFVFGGVYELYGASQGLTEKQRTSYGVLVGYRPNEIYFDVTYYILSDYDLGSGVILSGGSGIGVDFGYQIPLGSYFFCGAQLSYKSFSYSQTPMGSSINKINSEIYPMLLIGFNF